MINKENDFNTVEPKQNIRNIQILNNVPVVKDKSDILFEQVERIDLDIDYDFRTRTRSYNKLIEIANPILALSLRAKKNKHIDDVQGLYSRVRDEITTMAEEVRTLNYDGSVQLSFRYCVCSFVDEMIMGTTWGGSSIWAEKSMLSHFHNETWGGEKFYAILSRLMLEPEKYQELLEFIYICLALGFRGQYALQKDGAENIQSILIKLQKVLRTLRGEQYKTYDFEDNIVNYDYSIKKGLSLKSILVFSGLGLLVIYAIFSLLISVYSSEIIENISTLL